MEEKTNKTRILQVSKNCKYSGCLKSGLVHILDNCVEFGFRVPKVSEIRTKVDYFYTTVHFLPKSGLQLVGISDIHCN